MNSIVELDFEPGVPYPLSDTPVFVRELLGSTCAGFPSPAEDLQERRINLNDHLVTHPQATFIIKVRGLSMVDAGIFDGDLIVVNRALKPKHGCIVVAVVEGEYTVKHLYQRPGKVRLKAANPTFPDIEPKDGQTLEIWGVVTSAIKQFKY